jgi:DNA-binding NarL/FixJ family response regulator
MVLVVRNLGIAAAIVGTVLSRVELALVATASSLTWCRSFSRLFLCLDTCGSVDALFETVAMPADERSLMEAVTTFKPDLVVVDLSLPHEGEANTARRLMERHPDLRLIVRIVHDEPTVVGQMLSAGVAGFVLKCSAATDLIPAVREVLRSGTYVCPTLEGPRPESGDQPLTATQ